MFVHNKTIDSAIPKLGWSSFPVWPRLSPLPLLLFCSTLLCTYASFLYFLFSFPWSLSLPRFNLSLFSVLSPTPLNYPPRLRSLYSHDLPNHLPLVPLAIRIPSFCAVCTIDCQSHTRNQQFHPENRSSRLAIGCSHGTNSRRSEFARGSQSETRNHQLIPTNCIAHTITAETAAAQPHFLTCCSAVFTICFFRSLVPLRSPVPNPPLQPKLPQLVS